MTIKSTNEILSEILNIITSGLPLPDIKVQLQDIIEHQTVSQELQEQILQYINIISDNSDSEVDLLRSFIQIFSTYTTDMHSFYQDWLTNITDIKTNQNITNHLTLAIKSDTETMNNLMESSKQ